MLCLQHRRFPAFPIERQIHDYAPEKHLELRLEISRPIYDLGQLVLNPHFAVSQGGGYLTFMVPRL